MTLIGLTVGFATIAARSPVFQVLFDLGDGIINPGREGANIGAERLIIRRNRGIVVFG